MGNDLAILLAAVENPELWLLPHKQELTDAEGMQLSAYLYAVLRIQEHNWMQFQAGTLDEATWRSYQVGFVGVFSKPKTRKWWEQVGREYGEGFAPGLVQYADSLLRGAPLETVESELKPFR